MCLFHRRHTETSTEGVQAGGVVVLQMVWNRDTQQGADTQHRRLQESLQGTNRDHKGKYKGWWKQETYRSRETYTKA